MKVANPNLRIVAYINGTFDLSSSGTSYPASWYETSLLGLDPLSVRQLPPGSRPCELGAGGCGAVTAAITRSHYDGCFVDTLGTAPLDAGYVTGLPMNPSTHATWSAADWLTATAAIAAAVQSANPGAIVIANGLANGAESFSTSGATSALLGRPLPPWQSSGSARPARASPSSHR